MPEKKKTGPAGQGGGNNYNPNSIGDDKMKKPKRPQKKKVCEFCKEHHKGEIDYKEFGKLKRYVTEKGKIIPRRMSGTCAGHQRQLITAIKRARVMALLAFKAE